MSKPKILFIIDYYHPHIGWLEVVFDNIIKRLLNQGYEIGILTTKHLATLPSYEVQWNLQIRRVGSHRETFLFHALQRGRRIIGQFDVIHTTTYASAIPASILGKRYHKKVILTVHEVFWPVLRKRYKPYRRRLYQRFEQIIFRFPYNHIICVSHYTKKMLRKLYLRHEKLHVIYNGIDTSLRNNRNKDQQMINQFRETHELKDNFVLLYYGHSGASKWLNYLIKALPILLQVYQNLQLVLNIIPGKRDHKIFALIEKLEIQEHVIILHGLQQEILVSLVQLSDIVIVPSVSEGFGLVAAEVSALEHPLIVTKNASFPEVVSGKVVFLENYTPASFVDAVDKVKKKQWEDIPGKIFDWERTVREYKKLYM